MANLSKDEIRKYASAAGFTGNNLDIAVAVALAESGGNPQSHNAVPPDDSYGLWQINMLGGLGPDRRAKFNLKSNSDLYDPATNARVAFGIWQGSGWKAWTTYTRGTYKKYYDGTDESVDTTTTSDKPSLNPINGIGDAINAFGSTIFKGFANLAGVLVAIALVIIGLVILARDVTPLGKSAKLLTDIAGKVGDK